MKKIISLNKIHLRLSILCIVGAMLTACREKIDLPLKDKSGKIVIEGNITDDGNPAFVLVSKTTAYTDTLFFDGISGALVLVEHGGITDTFTEAFKGAYAAPSLQATIGETYNLSVFIDGNVYTSTSTAPSPVPIDSVYMVPSLRNNGVRPVAGFRDPENQVNYYKGELYLNGNKERIFEVSDDRLTNGKEKTIRFSGDRGYKTGDDIRIVLNSVDQGAYQYFYTLNVNSSAQSAAPANPTSNISGDVLGYFSAQTKSEKSFVY